MWSHLTTSSFISPLQGCVENKARPGENILRSPKLCLCPCVLPDARLPSRHLCESSANARDTWLLCLTTVQQRLFFGRQGQLISYDSEFPVRRRRGFDWKQRS